MARLVPDASATLSWCFEDEATPWTDALLAKLRAGDEATVPAHWPVEVANALLMAIRRGRISGEKANRFFEDLRAGRPYRRIIMASPSLPPRSSVTFGRTPRLDSPGAATLQAVVRPGNPDPAQSYSIGI